MKSLLFTLGLLLALAGFAPAQPKSGDTMAKIQKLDALVQIVPLTLTKKQVEALLPAIEWARAHESEIRKLEDKDLADLDEEVTTAMKNGIEKQVYPPRDLQMKIYKLTGAMAIRRQVAISENVDKVIAAVKKELNAGQIKVMEKSLDPKAFDPKAKVEEWDSDRKVRFFITKVFLDPAAYDVLVEMKSKLPN